MGDMSPRQARAEATRRSIIDAAVALFGDVGYGETDMIDVIERAGTTKGTCYYYFPTRESLAAAVIEHARLRCAEAVAEIWRSEGPVLRKLIAATFCFASLTESDDLVRVGYQLSQAGRQISEAGARAYLGTAEKVAAALKIAKDDGVLLVSAGVTEVANTLVAGVAGSRLYADADGGDCFDRLTQVWHVVLRGIVAEEDFTVLSRYIRRTARAYRNR